jgi:hypothetical protein
MDCRDNSIQAFFELVKAGLWEKDAWLSGYGEIAFSAVYRVAEEQSVVGLVAAGFEHVMDVKVPKRDVLPFVGNTVQLEQRNIAMNEYVGRLIEYLRKEDVYAILVKGQGVAQCYDRPLWRASGDVDLLLSNDNYERAKKVLTPVALSVEQEYTFLKHIGMMMAGGFEVELHGALPSRLSRRVDKVIDEVQGSLFYGGNVRSWVNGGTLVFLPAPNEDVIFIFTHFLRHFFYEGIGMRQICDWCRLLWTFRESIDVKLLEKRLRKMGLMTEWKAFAAYAVKWLGMPPEAMPLYSTDARWKRKADRICMFVMEVGNFGHNQKRDYRGMSYLLRKIVSFWGHLRDMLRHFMIFPKDSIVFIGGVIHSGMHAAVRGE